MVAATGRRLGLGERLERLVALGELGEIRRHPAAHAGRCRVNSAKTHGLDSLEEFDLLAGRQGDQCAFPIGTPADVAAYPPLLAPHDRRAHLDYVDVPQLLDRVFDFDLVGITRHFEQELGLDLLRIDLILGRPPVSLSMEPFSVRSGRLMILSGERMTCLS
jgi:hypothetical protein